MAEAIGRVRYPHHGWRSRGLRVIPGAGPTRHVPDALGDAVKHVIDHVASPITEQDIEWADSIYAMTNSHTIEIMSRFGASVDRLDAEFDIDDPFGGTADDYRHSLEQISTALAGRFESTS
jgi:protein arginine phosphatase